MNVYLAGAINGQSDDVAKNWRAEAGKLLPDHEMLDPMRRDYRGIEDANFGVIVDGDKRDILLCDVFLAKDAYPQTERTRRCETA